MNKDEHIFVKRKYDLKTVFQVKRSGIRVGILGGFSGYEKREGWDCKLLIRNCL